MDLSKYAALFLAETREHLRACNSSLLQWESDPAALEPVDRLFRAIHTIKGMAATMGYAPVAQLAHGTENLLDALRQGRVSAGPEIFQLLFRAVDTLGRSVEATAAGTEETADAGLITELNDAATAPQAGAAAAPASADPSAPPQPAESRTRRATDAPHSRPVQVSIRSGAVMRGARAALVVRRAERLGGVSGLRPPASQFERDEFDGRFSLRLQTRHSDEEIAAALQAVGDVEAVEFEELATPEADAQARARQIRVDLRRLDLLMKQVGELVVAKNRLSSVSHETGDPVITELSERISRLVSAMQGEVLAARMTPVGEVFERFPRLVRDLSRDLGKRIRFDMEGEEIELDRSILDEIGEPLVHLIRNAADHGIESPDERLAAGKPAEGRILLSATRERNTVAIRVVDDGRGIDREKILTKARREGAAPDADALTDDLLVRVLARPGFSTAASVSGVSGRGVGVDVAMTRVRALGGTLELRSDLGNGTTFMIRVPLTLAIVRALLTEAGGERYAIPLAYVAETVEFDRRAVTAIRDREAIVVRDQVIPTVHLRDLVGSRSTQNSGRRPTVILEVGERRAALVVDALVGQQDIVVEPFDAPRGLPPFVGGATILADGAPALILDAAELL
jgi:two-component system, chemotaxis family, sensor kinase CheA